MRHTGPAPSMLKFLAERGGTHTKTYGIDFLRNKLGNKAQRCELRYKYYEMKQAMRKISALIPPEFKDLTYSLGWCAKAVDTLAARLSFDGFENDSFYLGQIYKLNNADVLFDSAVLSALITSCSFIYIDVNEDGYPRLECIDGTNATGIIDTASPKAGQAVSPLCFTLW